MACSQDCNCRVIAGSGAVVRGTGATNDPYVISANANNFAAEDTDCIALDMVGNGTSTDPYTFTADLNIDPSADNLVVCGGSGILVDCDTVMSCVGDNIGCGLEFNNGTLCVMISEQPGNQITCRTDADGNPGLYADFDCDDVGCGLTIVNGQITVNTGTIAAGSKQGLICQNGVLKIDAGCGLAFNAAGALISDSPQIRAQNTVGNRNLNLDIPSTVTPANGDITDANGLSTEQNCITLNNTECSQMQGHLVFRYQFEAVVGANRDLEAQIQVLNAGNWIQAEELNRHYHAQGGNEIWSGYGERTVALNMNPGQTSQQCFRLMFHRTRAPGDLTGAPAAEARLLSYSTTVQAVLYRNQ